MHGLIGSFRQSQTYEIGVKAEVCLGKGDMATYVQLPENCKLSHRQPIQDDSRLHDVGERVRGCQTGKLVA